MARSRLLLHSLALTLVASPMGLMAQSSTTAALAGTVTGLDGKAIAGATIRITSPSLIGGERVARSAENGSYRYPMLPPGAYVITVEASGYVTRKATESLALGQATLANFKLNKEATATVEVVAVAGTAESAATGVTTNLSAQVIEDLPTGRDLTQVAGLTPGVTVSDYTSGAAVRAWGGDGAANAYTIDGLNVGDAKSGEKWVYANPEWFAETQVAGLGAPAEMGGFTGALINGVVKSGGNDLKGSLSLYWQDNAWAANRNNQAIVPSERTLPSGTFKDLTFTLGGPIVKDKIWYFISAETIKDNATDTAVGAKLPIELKNNRYLGKLTWQVTPNATWDAFLEYDTVDRENRYATRDYALTATQQQRSPSRLFTTSWTQAMANNAVLTFRLSNLNARDDRSSYNPSGFTIESDKAMPDTYKDPAGMSHPELTGTRYWGNVRRSNLLRANFRGRTTLSGTYDHFVTGLFSASDSHAFRVGFEVEQSRNEERRWIASPNGVAYRTRLRADASNNMVLRPYRAIMGGDRDVTADVARTMAFVQDTWTVNGRLTLRPGLRFEQFEGEGGGSTLWKTTTVAPRLGGTVALTEDHAHAVKFHLGRYFAGLSSDAFSLAIPGAYRPRLNFYWGRSSDVVNPYRPDLISFDPNPNGSDFQYGTSEVSRMAPDIKQPYTDEALLSYEWAVNANWTVSAMGVVRAARDILARTDPDYREGDHENIYNLLTGGTVRISYTAAGPTAYKTHQYVMANEPNARQYYRMMTVSADRRMADRWSLNASVTWAKNEGNYNASSGVSDTFADPNNMVNARGRLPFVNDREARLRFVYQMPWAWRTQVSAIFTYLSGERYTPFIALDYGGTYATDLVQNALGVYALERGAYKYPSRRLLDLRISQDLNFSQKVRTELFVDIFNVLNTGTSFDWNTTINDYDDAAGLKVLNRDWQKPYFSEDPRRVRFGFRIRF